MEGEVGGGVVGQDTFECGWNTSTLDNHGVDPDPVHGETRTGTQRGRSPHPGTLLWDRCVRTYSVRRVTIINTPVGTGYTCQCSGWNLSKSPPGRQPRTSGCYDRLKYYVGTWQKGRKEDRDQRVRTRDLSEEFIWWTETETKIPISPVLYYVVQKQLTGSLTYFDIGTTYVFVSTQWFL